MKFPYHNAGRRWLVLILAVAVSLAYVGLCAARFAASVFGGRVEASSLKRAAWLDPGDADYRDHLGRYFDLVARDPASAAEQYRAAVQINPHSARYWFDLASAYQVMGDGVRQMAALEHAIEADSMTPDVAWEAANLYLVQGENQKALREFRVVLANDPSLAPTAVQFCWRIEPDVDALLRDVIPPRSDAYLAFLTLLESKGEATDSTAKVWNALMQTNDAFELRFADNYFRYLVLHKDVDQAVAVWQQAANRFALTTYLPTPANLIVNGRFTLPVTGNGFDWQYQKQSGVKLKLDPTDVHPDPTTSSVGRQSLSIAFDGAGISDAAVIQFVAVHPNTTYDFSAFYKNGEIEGAGGPHLTIQDLYSQTIYFDSNEMKDAGFWKSMEGEFTTGPDCKMLLIHIRRLPAGSPIRGKVWIDDLRLTPKISDQPHS